MLKVRVEKLKEELERAEWEVEVAKKEVERIQKELDSITCSCCKEKEIMNELGLCDECFAWFYYEYIRENSRKEQEEEAVKFQSLKSEWIQGEDGVLWEVRKGFNGELLFTGKQFYE